MGVFGGGMGVLGEKEEGLGGKMEVVGWGKMAA